MKWRGMIWYDMRYMRYMRIIYKVYYLCYITIMFHLSHGWHTWHNAQSIIYYIGIGITYPIIIYSIIIQSIEREY